MSERGDEASACASSPAALAFTLSSNVGLEQSMRTAISIARPGGAVGRVGVLHGDESRSTAGSITALGGKAVAKRIRNVHLADTEDTESQADKK